ncbi:MAG: hypothetical protein BGO69_12670 [Bacteroidetes bacterium 46-16]|jgi:hypothetical protein|nr:MAG: hypothetical protein BGO69_12670 [Bacteroidetes bacterium 46-16]
MASITITHQSERTKHRFTVKNPDSLTQTEVNRICQNMFVQAIFVNGKYYEPNKPLDRDKYFKKLMRGLK